MMPNARTHALLASALLAAHLLGCGGGARPAVPTMREWLAGAEAPAFDPDGPPAPLRAALERLLSRGLVEFDSTGLVRLAAARRLDVSADSLRWAFRLRPDLRFTDGEPVTSAHFRDALRGGLARTDHSTRAWILAPVVGVDRVRAGRTLPPLGIDAPDESTLVLRLSRRAPHLLEHLALPGVATPWRSRARGRWSDAIGIGPYRTLREEPGRSLVLLRAAGSERGQVADTIRVRFIPSGTRIRTLLRHGRADVVWPVPPVTLSAAMPAGYALERRSASPARHLLIVIRSDVPPATKLPARAALWDAIDASDLRQALGASVAPVGRWLPGADAMPMPTGDVASALAWMDRGHLGRSFRVSIASERETPGADLARALQGQWAAAGFYAELRDLPGDEARAQALAAAAAQVQVVELQPPSNDIRDVLACLVLPLRGPAVGAFRTGWRTREFDERDARREPAPPDLGDHVRLRIAEERVVLPVAELPWLWIARPERGPVRIHPRYGPDFGGDWPGSDLGEVRR